MLMRPHRLATNSVHSARRLESRIARPVDVLYPPVRTDFFTPADRERRHFLVVSRLQPHKRLEVIVEAFRRLREPVVIAGAGPAGNRLALDSPSNVEFVGHVGDAELRELYRTSHAVVSGSIEEFGLCLAEAHAAGTAVIAPRTGGSGEIVRDGETGLLVDPVDPDSIVRAVRRLRRTEFDPESCRRAAERFSEERFLRELQDLIEPASKLTS